MPNTAPRQVNLMLTSLLLALLFNGLLVLLVGYEQSRAVALSPLHPRRVEQYIAQKAPTPLPATSPGALVPKGEHTASIGQGTTPNSTTGQGGGSNATTGTPSAGVGNGRQGSEPNKNSHIPTPSPTGKPTGTQQSAPSHSASAEHSTSVSAKPDPRAHRPTSNSSSHAAAPAHHGTGADRPTQTGTRGQGTKAGTQRNTGGSKVASSGVDHHTANSHNVGPHGNNGQHMASSGHGPTTTNGDHSDHATGSQSGGGGHQASGAAGTHDNGTPQKVGSSAGANGHENTSAAGAVQAGNSPSGHDEGHGASPQANSNTGNMNAGSNNTASDHPNGVASSGTSAAGDNPGKGNTEGNAQQAADTLTDKPYPSVTYQINGTSEMGVHYRNPDAQKVLDERNVPAAALDAKTPTYPTANEPTVDAAKDPLTYPILPPFTPPLQGKPGGVAFPTVLPIPQTFDVGALSWRGAISFPSRFLLVPPRTGRPIPAELQGDGSGVLGLYYQGANFEHLIFRRADPNIAVDWSHHRPDPRMPVTAYSVRWVGSIIPRYSERYTIYTATDDGARLWLNGKQVIDKWQIQAISENQTTIELTAGKPCDFVMEFFEKNGMSFVQAYLYWQSAHQQKENIPESCLKFPGWLWDKL